MSHVFILFRWWPLFAVTVFFLMGLVLGFFYSLETPQGHAWTQNFIQSKSHSEAFHFLGGVSIIWYTLIVALLGRSRWPVSGTRAFALYGPMAFAFGFAARFFVLLFGFIIPMAVLQSVHELAKVALVVFLYLILLVIIPTYATFSGSFTRDESLIRKVAAFVAIVLTIFLWITYT